MMRRHLLLAIAAILLTIAYSVVRYPALPDTVPVHWGPSGRPDGFASKSWGVALLPLTQIGLLALLAGLAALPSNARRIRSFAPVYGQMVVGTTVFLGAMQTLVVEAALGKDVVMQGTMALMWLFFLLIGNTMGKVTPNGLMGIRTRRTLADPEVWRLTHRWSARFMVAVSLVGLVLAAVGVSIWIQMALMFVWCTGPVVYASTVRTSTAP
jgi:uncharacterized membrane protein